MNYYIDLPEWDSENLRPKTKMPNCPTCGEDELGMLTENMAYCYCCHANILSKDKMTKPC
jgi:hypothetical protein